MRRVTPLRERDEQGAVVVLVALLMVTFLAIAALVIDVGSLSDERRQLQNGADAAALGVAHSCALGACNPGLANGLANGNASDKVAAVDSVSYPTATQVLVNTSTRSASGGTILPYFFAQAVVGEKGATVHARATASWSGIRRATVIPLVISRCEWAKATNNGTVFNTTMTGPVSVIYFHSGGQRADDCASSSGQDFDGDGKLPGGYGWVRTPGNNCAVTLSAGDTLREDPGVSGNSNDGTKCLTPLLGTNVLVPIFDDVNGLGGANGVYHILGFAELRLTGYRMPSATAGTPVPCNPAATCIAGYFTRFVATADAVGGPNLGAVSVFLVS